MHSENGIKVAIVGYGVIGRRVTEAVRLQPDMRLAGIADVAADWRIARVAQDGTPLFAATPEGRQAMVAAGLGVAGTLAELAEVADVIVDCTPKRHGAANAELYRRIGRAFIVQGGEKHEVAGHSFVAESSYAGALGREATRVVSCNTTSIVRTLGALKRAGLLVKARGTLLRRTTDPWESHLGGIVNTLVPEAQLPSHQGPDARSVDPDLDVVTIAIQVPETLGHLHAWNVELTRPAGKDEILAAFAGSSRILPVDSRTGLSALNAIKEWMADAGRSHANLYEVALWSDLLTVEGRELYYTYMVDNQAIVIPETIDAIRALAGSTPDAASSIALTNRTLGIGALQIPHAPVA
ncbi:type II glyceraldehyde-3-phosphate dehydrogenase [Sphingomonas canadensis]|uniref:Type II glyceraldehyde-3-phosphate dehydrogenase n=1 Tax=Sphingomonas canadensis TaxID=1219257 RepID=A0ABW3H8F8_9SPHN|nr:type II glyceraldehyde-3-phosphate dehydrogenase [Sphingomonas canadensis]MCW3837305.1 type II glyceraldehyde-3-phosphate dehydrogenase [Sphingomonas canadensis]